MKRLRQYLDTTHFVEQTQGEKVTIDDIVNHLEKAGFEVDREDLNRKIQKEWPDLENWVRHRKQAGRIWNHRYRHTR